MKSREHPIHLRYRQRRLFARDVMGSSEIDAPIDLVWDALVDFKRYPEWNTFTRSVGTNLEVGSPVEIHMDLPGRFTSILTEWVNLVERGSTICWGMHMGHPLILCANRWQELQELPGGRTRYVTTDRFSGLLVPIQMRLNAEPMRLGFQSVADGLKAWVEGGNH